MGEIKPTGICMKKFVIFPSNTLESGRAFGERTTSKELFKIEAKGM